MKRLVLVSFVLLAGCATVAPPPRADEVQILAINDFHGNLEPPNLTVQAADGAVPAGGSTEFGFQGTGTPPTSATCSAS